MIIMHNITKGNCLRKAVEAAEMAGKVANQETTRLAARDVEVLVQAVEMHVRISEAWTRIARECVL